MRLPCLLRPLLLGLSLALPALPPAALGQDLMPVVLVNNAAVTRYELDQRLRMMQALRAPGADAASVERDLINERLKVQEARNMGIVASDAAVQAGMEEFAGRANLDAAGLIALLAEAGVERQAFRDFVTAGVVWREVLKQRVAPAVRVTDREVDQAMKRLLETPKVTEVLISEIIMPAPPGTEAQVTARAEEIIARSTSEAAFAGFARQYSATPSAGSGGRLPWTGIENLPQGLGPILLALKPGQVTQPLTIPGAVVLFYLRDTRGTLRPGARDEVLEYARVTVASASQAAQLQARAESCDMLHVAARGIPVERQTGGPGTLPADIVMRLASLDPNEGVVIDRGGAADLLMLCKRTPALLAASAEPGLPAAPAPAAGASAGAAQPVPGEDALADPLPERSRVRDAVFARKVDQAEQALLAELRANAVIRRR